MSFMTTAAWEVIAFSEKLTIFLVSGVGLDTVKCQFVSGIQTLGLMTVVEYRTALAFGREKSGLGVGAIWGPWHTNGSGSMPKKSSSIPSAL